MVTNESLTQMYFGFLFDLIFWILVFQMVVVGLLIVPVPSNKYIYYELLKPKLIHY